MKLELCTEELRALAEQGLLNDLVKSCTMAGPAAEAVVEEKPKKKTAKKTAKKEEPKPDIPKAEEPKTELPHTEVSQEEVRQMPEPQTVEDPTVPTQMTPAQSFTAEDLSAKAIALMDSGKQEVLQELLGMFNVRSLPELQPEQYVGFYQAMCDAEGAK